MALLFIFREASSCLTTDTEKKIYTFSVEFFLNN